MIEVRDYQKEDYELLKGWWSARSARFVPEELLPPDGKLVSVDGVPVFAAFVYYATTQTMAWLAHMISRPGIVRDEKNEPFKMLIYCLEKEAKDRGYKCFIANVSNGSLLTRLCQEGYQLMDFDAVTLTKDLMEV